MQKDPTKTIRRVAEFCGIELDDELLELTIENSSIGFMKTHKDRFDDALMRAHGEKVAGIPPGAESSKVREGRVGDHKKSLPASIIDALDALWAEKIEPVTGHKNYESLLAEVEAEEQSA